MTIKMPKIVMKPVKCKCRRIIGYDKAGKPRQCLRPGFGMLEGFRQVPLCKTHMEEEMEKIELSVDCMHISVDLNEDKSAIVCHDCGREFPIRKDLFNFKKKETINDSSRTTSSWPTTNQTIQSK